MKSLSITWANETLHLFPERALWWPRQSTLFITDPHFGKAATFRHAGIPICESSHDADLLRLTHILNQTNAQHLIILGDFLHARTGNNPTPLAALPQWRATCPGLPIPLIPGNHDRHAGPPAQSLNIELVHGPWPLPPFTCCHEPESLPDHFTLAGHLHPAHRLSTNNSSLTAPCFHLSQNLLILPAFGTFTGTSRIHPKPGDKIYLVGPTEVLQIPTR
ncbi:ligase-associated DNA damage response endonuclease PdeM [Phragmitibacter flavus]|uniref:ligase-associated DNA damage response endonuclease PdeM n=1 Tax=Phragmitibacter flavus TaxID=2576071 RepID=UPI00140E6309|nr:ligase-associated DNA damage response endonuclease PdeM [Phragmitibacter flavus]